MATTGKGTIQMLKGRSTRVIVTVVKEKRRYHYKITQKALDVCLGMGPLDKAARRIFRTSARELWQVC